MDTSNTLRTFKNYLKQQIAPVVQNKTAVEAYDIWAENYDSQPGNLMLDLDEQVFAELLNDTTIKHKAVADIGCGTGRHWAKVFAKRPASLTGFDVSPGMLEQLKKKYPRAETLTIRDNLFSNIADRSYDVIISTLTVAHIKNIEEALKAWCRLAKSNSDIIITDFHPDILAAGGKRTFRDGKKHIAVQNYVHSTETIRQILFENGFGLVDEIEKRVDDTVKHYYQDKNALHVYERYKGFWVIYGMHFRRTGNYGTK